MFGLFLKIPQRIVSRTVIRLNSTDAEIASNKMLRPRRTGENNFVRLVGFLGKDPDIKTGISASGFNYAITSFTLATKRAARKMDSEPAEETDWHRIVQFSESHDGLQKGDLVEVTGYLTYDKYTPTWAEDKNKKITSAKIVAKELKILKKRNEKTDEDDAEEDNE